MVKVLKVLAWVFTATTLIVGIIGLSGNETVVAYVPASAGVMVAFMALYLIFLNWEKQQPTNQ